MGQEAAPVSSAAIVIVERKDGLNGNYTGQVEKGRRRGGGLDGSVPLVTHLVPPLNKASRNEWSLSRSRPQPPPIAPSLSPSLPSLHPLLLDVFLASSVYGVSRNWPHRDSIVVETAVYGFYGLLYQIFSPLFGDLECRSASSRITTLAYINYCTLSGWRTIWYMVRTDGIPRRKIVAGSATLELGSRQCSCGSRWCVQGRWFRWNPCRFGYGHGYDLVAACFASPFFRNASDLDLLWYILLSKYLFFYLYSRKIEWNNTKRKDIRAETARGNCFKNSWKWLLTFNILFPSREFILLFIIE